jgi:ubiquinone/menaquinone biosynthesis C-methylase UbiE
MLKHMDKRIETVRENYDRIAKEYASRLFDELTHKPLDRELLERFARETRGRGEVCDLGCGPGHVARYLRDANVAVFGVDLSPHMLEEARRRNPDIRFREGDMLSLQIPTETLAGIAALYAIVNTPEELLPSVFREMARVLKPGGTLLIAFHIGDEIIRVEELLGHSISMDFFLFQPPKIRTAIEASGFTVEDVIVREPYPDVEYQSRRAYIFARKPRSGHLRQDLELNLM